MDPGALKDRVQVAYGRAFNPFATTSRSVAWNKRRDSGRTAAYFNKVVVPDTHDPSPPGMSERKTKGTEGPVTNLFTMIAPSSIMPLGPIVMSPFSSTSRQTIALDHELVPDGCHIEHVTVQTEYEASLS
jgi:hypothetical protein